MDEVNGASYRCKTCAAWNENDDKECRIGLEYSEFCDDYDEIVFESGEQRASQIIGILLKRQGLRAKID